MREQQVPTEISKPALVSPPRGNSFISVQARDTAPSRQCVSKQCPPALPDTQRPADTPACNGLPVVVTSTPTALPEAEPGSA